MTKIALITGATSGIGNACAKRLAAESYNIIITGRRADRLRMLQEELENMHPVQVLPLTFDICDRKATEETLLNLPEKWKNIDVLINNAGLALNLNTIDEGNLDEWEQMIDTNLKGLLYVTRMVTPSMKSLGRGHIINIGSIAGREVYPKGNVYCATKYAVDALSKAMRIDLLPYGIKVTQICPGAVETEFSQVRFAGNKERAIKVYEGYKPLTGEDVANVVAFAVGLPAHVNINDLLLMPTAQATATIFDKNI
ncbi:MAG TPA: NAD(P)-dependent oxidoreductase [Bacteroidales bacterium]|nr:NAD(P)-dependent oxidoreductase [Bacteroidales bacterium]